MIRFFMAGMQEGLLPHSMAEKENGVEEERRLCYVGMTRAKQRLYLSWARSRMVYSKRSAQAGLPYEIMQCEMLTVYRGDTAYHAGCERREKRKSQY